MYGRPRFTDAANFQCPRQYKIAISAEELAHVPQEFQSLFSQAIPL